MDVPGGKLAIGVRFSGQPVLQAWDQFLHLRVLGNTDSGKSIFLQSLVSQALRDDMMALLSDIDQTTFGMLACHPNLAAPIATSPQAAHGLIEHALSECDRSAELFKHGIEQGLLERPRGNFDEAFGGDYTGSFSNPVAVRIFKARLLKSR